MHSTLTIDDLATISQTQSVRFEEERANNERLAIVAQQAPANRLLVPTQGMTLNFELYEIIVYIEQVSSNGRGMLKH